MVKVAFSNHVFFSYFYSKHEKNKKRKIHKNIYSLINARF